ncbi:hypothetical protein AUC43_05815 [Hymenobacter sedentarius]|uniref:Integrase catalytic domain-containing protein n=1 Tax=Hymenobacter sedentarius TaxID=1411621 RepID=A0A0U3JVK1_9BACT|nr:IS3 family transposase [Hymenobacter sedentarius]ALW84639.1 hypothetical protein AUC43_05815 [Hymenobacter sedentarius]
MKDSPQLVQRRRYDAAFRAEAFRLAGESHSTQAAARPLNISSKLLYKWQKESLTPVVAARGAALDPVTAAELRQLRAANRRRVQELEILKSHRHLLAHTRPMSRYRFIEAQWDHYPVRLLCQLVAVPASGYYAWQQAQQHKAEQQEPAWETALLKAFGMHQRCYGTRRLRVELRRKGYRVGRQRLRTAMRRRGLHALQPKAFTPRTTDFIRGLRCAPNWLLDQPKSAQANQLWVSDITCLPLANGDWAYLSAFQDMASKHVMGWQVGATMPEELVTRALQRAFWSQPAMPGLLVHSDRGGQNCGNAYRQLLHDHEALRSQNRRGDCYDNA